MNPVRAGEVEIEMRMMDSWLRKMAIVGPITAFLLGWGSGFLTAALLYRDHEKRIQTLEQSINKHAEWANGVVERIGDRIIDLEIKTGIRKPKGNR